MAQVLILGGTGAMGSHLTPLLTEDYNVFVTSREKRESDTIRYIQGDAHNNEFLGTLLTQKWDCIVDFMHYGTKEFSERIDDILSATTQYIFLSSCRVFAESKSPIIETSPRLIDVCNDAEYLETDEYALAKARCENILQSKPQKNWTIVRPTITYSETRLQLGASEKEDWLYKALHGYPIVFSDDLKSKVTTMTYAGDVARAIKALVGNKNCFGEDFNLTGTDYKTWSEVLEIYRNTLALKEIATSVYMTPITWNLRYKSKYQVLYSRYFDRIFDNSKISKFVDTTRFISMEDGLTKCLTDFLKNPNFVYDEYIENLHRLYETEHRVGNCEIHGANVDTRFDILEKRVSELEQELSRLQSSKNVPLIQQILQHLRGKK